MSDAAPPPLDWSTAGVGSALNLFFVSQFWGLQEPPPFNRPFWSMSYEAAYYAIFAAWIFTGRRWRTVFTSACCVLAGPKILLLMPCWLLGVWLYRHPSAQNMKPSVATSLFLGSIVGFLTLYGGELPIILSAKMDALWPWPMHKIGDLHWFVGDYLIALLVTANFAAVARVPKFGSVLIKAKRSISLAASFTLSIYLYHSPLLSLLRGGFGCSTLITLIMMIVGIIGLGLLTEHKRTTLRRLLTAPSMMMSNPLKISAG